MPRAAKDPGLDVSPSGPTRCSGLPAFRVVAPRGTETPLVVEAPHAGLFLDGEALASLVVSARSVARDADLYVDELVEDAADEGATLLCAHTSRYLVDLNRAETEHDGHAVAGSTGSEAPHGIVWHRGTDGESALRTPLPPRELERRLATYYRPYHAALAQLLADKQKRFGHAILVCAHSMPSNGTGIGGRVFPRADVVPGTRGRASASASLIDEVDALCRSSGLSVRHDDPYRGGFTTAHYGRPDRGVHAIQIELARRLYMNEDALCRIPEGVARMRAFYRELARRLARVVPSRPVLPVAQVAQLPPSSSSPDLRRRPQRPASLRRMAAAGSPMSGIRPKPLLASDALKEDVAPLQPAEVGARRLAAGMAALMVGIATSLQLGLGGKAPSLAALSAGAAAIPLALLALRVPYRTRAYALLGLGLALLVESLAGRGPGFAVLSDPGTGLPWEIARALTATVLPAALLFRASYRAYPVARTLLAWALVLSLPFVVRSGYVVLFEHEMAARVAAGATIASILLALLGFMGSGTTAMGSAWATCLLGILAGEIALRQVFGVADGSLRHVIAAASFLAGSTLAAVGLFQSVSVAKAGEARCIDVRRNREEPSEASRPSGEY